MVKEIPELVQESFQLTKEYIQQETIEPAKRLGRAAGFGFAGAFVFGLAATFGGIAINRLIIRLLPDGRAWSGLGYVISAVVLILLAVATIALGNRNAPQPEPLFGGEDDSA